MANDIDKLHYYKLLGRLALEFEAHNALQNSFLYPDEIIEYIPEPLISSILFVGHRVLDNHNTSTIYFNSLVLFSKCLAFPVKSQQSFVVLYVGLICSSMTLQKLDLLLRLIEVFDEIFDFNENSMGFDLLRRVCIDEPEIKVDNFFN
jgi:hypothetical protein